MPHETRDEMLLHTWHFIGGSERDAPEAIRAMLEHKPDADQRCFSLYFLLLSCIRPCPSIDLWVNFGFAACTSQEQEAKLGVQYRRLIDVCTFDAFCNAYRGRRLLSLFRAHGLDVPNSAHFGGLLHGRAGMTKSVWHLKQYIAADADGQEAVMIPSVMVEFLQE